MECNVPVLTVVGVPDSNTIILLLGCFFLVVGVLGGGFEIKEMKVPPIERGARVIAVFLGISLLAISLGASDFVKSQLANYKRNHSVGSSISQSQDKGTGDHPTASTSETQKSVQASPKEPEVSKSASTVGYGKKNNLPSKSAGLPSAERNHLPSESGGLPFFMTRLIRQSDLEGRTRIDLDEWRNEIFARHGRMFKDPLIQKYFNEQPWYHPRYPPNEFPSSLLSKVQQANVQTLYRVEYR